MTFTLTATDADGDAASLPFTLRAYPADPTPGFAAGIPDQTYRQNSAIAPLTLPEAVGGVAPVTYTLTPGPPAGLGVASADRVLSGTPMTPQPARIYHWTATDDNGDAATLAFSIEVREDLQPTFPSTGPDLSYRVGRRITPEVLPAAVGGDGPLTYALTPSLPRGLGFTPATRTISGAPAAEQRRTTYLLTATDADGDAASLSFTLTADTVDTIPRFAAGIPDQTYRQNTAIAPLTLPEAVGGVAPLTYALTPGPPAGLGVASADRVLSGTPVTPQPARTYHWTATDDNGDAATLTFSIEVREDLRPTFPSTGPDLSYRVGRLITPEALPAAVGGDGPAHLCPDAEPPARSRFHRAHADDLRRPGRRTAPDDLHPHRHRRRRRRRLAALHARRDLRSGAAGPPPGVPPGERRHLLLRRTDPG